MTTWLQRESTCSFQFGPDVKPVLFGRKKCETIFQWDDIGNLTARSARLNASLNDAPCAGWMKVIKLDAHNPSTRLLIASAFFGAFLSAAEEIKMSTGGWGLFFCHPENWSTVSKGFRNGTIPATRIMNVIHLVEGGARKKFLWFHRCTEPTEGIHQFRRGRARIGNAGTIRVTSEFTYFDAVRFLHDVTFAAAQIDLAAGIGRRSGLLDRRGGHFQCVKVQAVLEFQFAGIWLQLRMRWIRFRRPEQLENNCKVQRLLPAGSSADGLLAVWNTCAAFYADNASLWRITWRTWAASDLRRPPEIPPQLNHQVGGTQRSGKIVAAPDALYWSDKWIPAANGRRPTT